MHELTYLHMVCVVRRRHIRKTLSRDDAINSVRRFASSRSDARPTCVSSSDKFCETVSRAHNLLFVDKRQAPQ